MTGPFSLTLEQEIMACLPTKKDQAYSPRTILAALKVDRRPDYIRQICRVLLQAGKIKSVKISYKDVRYYKIDTTLKLSDVPQVPWLIKPQRSAA